MLGMILTMADKPMVIQDSGVFVLGVALTCIVLAFIIACCMIVIRDGFEVIVEVECYDAFYDTFHNDIRIQSRFNEIVSRVQQSLGGDDVQIAVLGFPAF